MFACPGFNCFFYAFVTWVFLLLLSFFCLAGTTRFPKTTAGEKWNLNTASMQIWFQEHQTNRYLHAKIHCKQFVELTRYVRVMGRVSFFSYVYTFSAMCTSLRIWAPHPPKVGTQHPMRNCVGHLAALSHVYATPSWLETGQEQSRFDRWGALTR